MRGEVEVISAADLHDLTRMTYVRPNIGRVS